VCAHLGTSSPLLGRGHAGVLVGAIDCGDPNLTARLSRLFGERGPRRLRAARTADNQKHLITGRWSPLAPEHDAVERHVSRCGRSAKGSAMTERSVSVIIPA